MNNLPIGVVLAGGKSSRMGRDKALCEVDGVRLIDRVVARLRPQASRIVISAPQDYGTGLEFIPDDPREPEGPCAGVFAIARSLAGDATGFLTAPVDAPLLPHDLGERLIGPVSAIATAGRFLHPTFAWWIVDDVTRARLAFADAKGLSLRDLARLVGARAVAWGDDVPFANVNTPTDLETLQRAIHIDRSGLGA